MSKILNSYGLGDFIESLKKTEIKPMDIESVVGAYGNSDEGYGEWSGGFIMKMRDGQLLHLSGWCDTSGWGCQDGADTETGQHILDFHLPENVHLDKDPQDLNRWLKDPDREDNYP